MSRAKPEITYLPSGAGWEHFGAIVYFAVLAYPLRSEWGKRDAFIAAMKTFLWKERRRQSGNRQKTPNWIQNRKIDGVLGHAWRRIERYRLPAAEIGWLAWLYRAMRSKESITRIAVSIGETRAKMDGRELQYEAPNFLHRAWAASKPVLHLAMVFPSRAKGQRTVDPIRLISDPSWLVGTLRKGEQLRCMLHHVVPTFDNETAVRLLCEDPHAN